MIRIITFFTFIVFLLNGCFSISEESKAKPELGNMDIKYYSNKSVTSLEIPPDLTTPETQNSFVLSEFVPDIKENIVGFSNRSDDGVQKILDAPTGIKVKKDGEKRWLVINKTPDEVWEASREFLKNEGFVLVKQDKKIGILETDFLENRPDIPEQSLGFIRSMLGRALNQNYVFASVDKYRIRIEPIEEGKQTELFLSLTSMEEVVDDRVVDPTREGVTVWKNKEKDLALEIEMLYRLMIFLGGQDVKNKILQASDIEKKISARVDDGINGYAKLIFDSDLMETWEQISWSIDQNNFDLEDKDILEKSFYIRSSRTADRGIISKILGDEAIRLTFKLTLKEISKNQTEVYFIDISEKNEKETKEFSYDLFNQILSKL